MNLQEMIKQVRRVNVNETSIDTVTGAQGSDALIIEFNN